MPTLLEGKVALVTGAARGQGRSHCVRLAEEGADIIAMDICAEIDTIDYPLATPEDLEETVALVERLDRRIIATHTDVRDGAGVRAAVDAGVAELGRLDTVVVNHGVTQFARALELDEARWRTMIDVNLTGAWNVCSSTLPHLVEGGRGGSVILVSSALALRTQPNIVHYATTKAGMVGLMQGLAVEFGSQMIRVNTIHPTTVDTPMIRNQTHYDLFSSATGAGPDADGEQLMKAALTADNLIPVPWVDPVDVSHAVVFLASDHGRFVTGSQFRVDAGNAAK